MILRTEKHNVNHSPLSKAKHGGPRRGQEHLVMPEPDLDSLSSDLPMGPGVIKV